MFSLIPNQLPRLPRPTPVRREAYALVMCLLVVAVSSSIVLSLFHVLRLQTSESLARRQLTTHTALADAAVEHAIAVLLDQPAYQGSFGPISPPGMATNSYQVRVTQGSGNIQIAADIRIGSSLQSIARTIPSSQLIARRAAIGLAP